jgi:hypothetical protein
MAAGSTLRSKSQTTIAEHVGDSLNVTAADRMTFTLMPGHTD